MSSTMSEFVTVASISELTPGKMKRVTLAGHAVLLANLGGNFYAIGAECTHVGGPLEQGQIIGEEVQCPWHGSHFDLKTGEVKRGPARLPEPKYEVRVEGSEVKLRPTSATKSYY
jgi:nitrite reductase/ring-hydroxylating ferredoxin subunit